VTEWCSELDSIARRCVQCGERVDPVILENRELQAAGTLSAAELHHSSQKVRS
jgi:hypothetical protein